MNRWIFLTGVAVLLSNIISSGCKEWPVGAPCVSETDTGEFEPIIVNPGETLPKTDWSIEARSVQCQGSSMVCLTTLTRYEEPEPNEDADNEYEQWLGTHAKYSFCSCRCRDAQGHGYDRNSDKYDDLCECPSGTRCVDSDFDEDIVGENTLGSYCLPNCVANDMDQEKAGTGEPCHEKEPELTCTPSSDSDEPWNWGCKDVDAGSE